MENDKKDTTKKATSAVAEKKTVAPPLNIFQRMLAATSEINRVAKNLKVDVTKTSSYKAVAEADVLESVKPVEEKHGIYSYPFARKIIKDDVLISTSTWDGKTTEKQSQFMRVETTYRFVNIDNPTDFIDITTYGDGVDAQDKAPGKAMTYADKYALLKAYKIQTGDDPDTNPSGDMKRKPKVVEKPTTEQLKKAGDLGIDLNKLAVYLKCQVAEISAGELVDAIEMKQKALAKQKPAANIEPKTDATPEPQKEDKTE